MGSVTRLGRRQHSRTEHESRVERSLALRSVVAETEIEFLALEHTWRTICLHSDRASATEHWNWLTQWWNTYAKGAGATRPFVVTVFDGPSPIAIFPFYVEEGKSFLSIRRLHQMGYEGELDPPSLTEEPLALVANGYEGAVAEHVSRIIARGLRRGHWDCASFRTIALQKVSSKSGIRHGVAYVAKTKQGARIAPLPATWNEFRSGLSKSMRDNLRYYPRLLERDGRDAKIEVHSDRTSVLAAVEHLVRLHRKRAQDDNVGCRDDHIPTSLQADMLKAALPELATNDAALVATLTIDGLVVAAQAFLYSDRQLLVHYSGFDSDYSRYSPLLVVQSEVIRWAIDRKITEMNVLLGDAPWQKRWNAEPIASTRQYRMASLWPVSLLRCTGYALKREWATRERRNRFGLCLISLRQGMSGFYAGLHEVHLGLSRMGVSPIVHHLLRCHR